MNKENLNGVYLVVDPSMDHAQLPDKVQQALEGGIDILQVWNHWPDGMQKTDKEQFIAFITSMAADYGVPVLINDDWRLLKSTNAHGVHFDALPENWDQIKEEVEQDFIAGITCTNDLDTVRRAADMGLDYISFCAMFPSPSVDSCEIVKPETVCKAREITNLPLFLSGGITPEKIDELAALDFDGVAVISGILKDENPKGKAMNFNQSLSKR